MSAKVRLFGKNERLSFTTRRKSLKNRRRNTVHYENQSWIESANTNLDTFNVKSEESLLKSLPPSPLEVAVKTIRQGENAQVFRDSKPGTRFRDIVREFLIAIKRGAANVDQDQSKTGFCEIGAIEDGMTFNANLYRAGASGAAGLAKKARHIFEKSYWKRTDDDIDVLYPIVDHLKYFENFSVSAKRELARVVGFQTYENDRVIIKEGHKGTFIYFIVSGSVSVSVSYSDKNSDEVKSMVVAKLPPGTSFGELALIQDCTRSATVTCIGTSEFLTINKNELEIAQKRSYEKEIKERQSIISSSKYFKGWTDNEIDLAVLNSKVLTYEKDQIILGNLTWDPPEFFYLLINGHCKIIKKLMVGETRSHIRPTQKQLKFVNSETEIGPEQTLASRLLDIGSLNEGELFCCGEDLKSTYVLACSKVRCLVISGYILDTFDRMARTSGNIEAYTTNRLKDEAANHVMSDEEAFDSWMINVRWNTYKKKLVRAATSNSKRRSNQNMLPKKSLKQRVTIENPVIGRSPMSQTNFKALAELRKQYSAEKYQKLLKTLKMQLHESEENVFENMLYQIKDNSLEEPLVPMSEEVEMLRRSFIGGITNTLVRSSMDIKATEELTFMNNDMANTSLFDLVVEEQRSSIPKKSKVQLRKSNLSCEGEKTISVPSDYNKKLLKTASKKSTIRKSDGAKESFDLQSKSRDSKQKKR